GMGIELPAWTKSAKRVCARSVETWIARAFNERWASVCGVSSPIFANAASEAAVAANGASFATVPLSRQSRSTRGPRACRMSFRTVLGQKLVEQNDVCGQVLHLAALGVIRALGRGDQQAKHQRRDRSGQAGAESDDVLCIVGKMMTRQRPAQERSGERSGKDD